MEYWHAFLEFEYANEVMMILGTFLVVVGVMKIIRSSIKLLFWVLLSGVGEASVSYGMSNSPLDLPGINRIGLSDLDRLRSGLSNDVLKLMCIKLDEIEGN